MMCAKCDRVVNAGALRCPGCGADPLLDGRYRLDSTVLEDAAAVSYRATRTEDGLLIRARALSIDDLDDREQLMTNAARVLELSHPGLPRTIEHSLSWTARASGARSDTLWLIHEHQRGETLAALVAGEAEEIRDRGWLIELIERVAEVLAYLHGRPRPITHGLVSLETILVRERSPCAVSLLDLGGNPKARHEARDSEEREPDRAQLTPAIDVWALGQVATGLQTHTRALSEQGKNTQREHTGELVEADAGLVALLERMLDPDPAQRISSAKLVVAAAELRAAWLASRRASTSASPQPRSPPRSPPALPGRAPSPAPRFMMGEPIKPTAKSSKRPPALGHARRAEARSSGRSVKMGASATRRQGRGGGRDIPVMRPEDLSRELSQAYRATDALHHKQRKHLNFARALVVLIAATIAALATYLALRL